MYVEVYCPVGPCPASWQPDAGVGNVFARAVVNSATLLIRDPTPPVIGDVRADRPGPRRGCRARSR